MDSSTELHSVDSPKVILLKVDLFQKVKLLAEVPGPWPFFNLACIELSTIEGQGPNHRVII